MMMMMMLFSEELTARPSRRSGRLFVLLMAGLALAAALSMAFAGDAEAKKKKSKPRKPPTTNLPAPPTCHQPPVYSGGSFARAWGSNFSGQLGDGTNDPEYTVPVWVTGDLPTLTPASSSSFQVPPIRWDTRLSGLKEVSAGGSHNLALKDDCTVWAWGGNSNGQLGNGTTTDRNTPVKVSGLGGVKAVSAGAWHSLALKEDGTVFAWGRNTFGQLGDGTSGDDADRYTPVQVKNLQGVKAIAAGGNHSLALKEDGTVWAWGLNFSGQLGDGTTTDRNTPVQVKSDLPTLTSADSSFQVPPIRWPDLSGVKAISAGDQHNLALMEDGTVRAWGYNLTGELGNGTSGTDVPYTVAVRVKNLQGVKAVSAGFAHSLALKEEGTVFAWGWNGYGQLGDGSITDRNTPVQVQGAFGYLSGIKAIAAGDTHNLALKEEGTVFAWGWNEQGQLGNGTTEWHITPVRVGNLSEVRAIDAGVFHNLVVVKEPPEAQP